jgi:hypothetical protein
VLGVHAMVADVVAGIVNEHRKCVDIGRPGGTAEKRAAAGVCVCNGVPWGGSAMGAPASNSG